MKPFAFIVFFFTTFIVDAQHLSAYSDYMDRFYIFDKGKSIKVEDLKVQDFKVGGECVVYINSGGHLKLYYNGKVERLEAGGIGSYFATDHLAAYSVFEKLRAVQEGKVYDLSSRCTSYIVEDSLIAFYDKNKESLRVFYNGEIEDIESGMIGSPISEFASGDNIVAYISARTKNFKIWHKGEVTIIEKYIDALEFKAGCDVVAYVDNINQRFKIFYKGKVYKLEDLPPTSFDVGNGFVAYIDYNGAFKVFYNEEVIEISGFAPDTYLTEDYMLVFTEDNYFKTFYKGQIYEVEGYIPKEYKLDWHTIAYLDNSNRMWIYKQGEKQYFANEFVNSFEIYRDLIQLNVKVNRNITYYNKQFYEGQSFFK